MTMHNLHTGRYRVRVGPETFTAVVNKGYVEVSCGDYGDHCAPSDIDDAVRALLLGATRFTTVTRDLRRQCWESEGRPFEVEGVWVRASDFFGGLGGCTQDESHTVGCIRVGKRVCLGLYRGPYIDSTFHSPRWTLIFGEASNALSQPA